MQRMIFNETSIGKANKSGIIIYSNFQCLIISTENLRNLHQTFNFAA